jgi:hypothetical protein
MGCVSSRFDVVLSERVDERDERDDDDDDVDREI